MKKKIIVTIVIIGIITIASVFLCMYFKNSSDKKILDVKMIELSEYQYETYYASISDNETLSYYEDSGISFNVANVLSSCKDETLVNTIKKLTTKCDLTKSVIEVYPVAPYTVDDKIINYTLECE